MSLLDKASLIVTPNAVKESKLYSVVPSSGAGDMDVVRATTATRVNSAGLIEVVPRNLLTYSEDFTNGWYAYVGSATATANYGVSPTGTNTSTRIVFTSTNQIWAKAITGLTGLNGTFSLYIKGSVGQKTSITYGGVDNLVTLGNGWNRFSVSAVATIDFVFISTFGGATALDIQVWGGQVEQGSTATEYFPTTTRLNIPRIDYTNGSCPSLLVEPQRTNVVKYSEDFSNVNWLKINLNITSNATIAPDGTLSADKVIPTTTNSAHAFYQAVTTGTYTFSIYAKAAEETVFSMWLNDFSKRAIFDLTTGTITSTSSGTVANITSVGNGWYKCDVYDSTLTSFVAIYSRSGNGFAGNNSDGMYFWGTQAEIGSYPTSYIPTVASAVTRNADLISKTGISSLIGQTEGTLFCDVNLNSRVSFSYLALSTDLTTSSNYLGIAFLANAIAFESVVGAALQANISYSNSSTGRFKIAAAYKANDFVLYINGTQIGTDTSGTVPACSQLGLNAFSTAQALNYNSVQVYKTKLSNTELAQLTTL